MRSMCPWRIVGLMSTALMVVAWGCDGGGSAPAVESSTSPANVSGTVTIKGKTATRGKVTFDPTNIQRPTAKASTAEIGKDGTYKITAMVGENRVVVDSPEIHADSTLGNGETSFTAKAGENTFNIAIPPQ
jgi:hypothetical protein